MIPYLAVFRQWVIGCGAAATVFVCYLLPYTTACCLGLGVLGLLTYVTWQVGVGAAALLLVFNFFPTFACCLLGLAAWLLFLVILPRLCLFLTEFSLGTFYFPFHWPFAHVVLLCILCSNLDWRALLPMGAFCALLYFFPRTVLSLVSLIILWMLFPVVREVRTMLIKLIESPYQKALQEGEAPSKMPEKVKSSEQAAEIANAGRDHYEVLNAHRGASPAEIKACYRRMALMLHPDKNPSEGAAAAFKRVSDAFTVLGEAETRAEYDADTDNGQAAGLEGEQTEEKVRPPESMPEGPPGLKNRKARRPPRH